MRENKECFLKISVIISCLLAALLLIANFWLGKANFFLLLNFDAGPIADRFFKYITYVGDGLMWVPILLFIAIWNRPFLIIAIFTALYSTGIAQIFKNWILHGQLRPVAVIQNLSLIHFVSGVEVHDINSFPSGHTTVAFSVMLLFSIITKNKWIICFLFLLACCIAYSRIYLGQHFPLDLAGGIFTAVIAILLAKASNKYIESKWIKNNTNSIL